MTTYGSLIEEITSNLQGFTSSPDQQSYLSAPLNSSDTVLSVADASQFGRGFAEIDLELVYVNSTDKTANTITLTPQGRGQRGTTAVAHLQGATITMAPSWPRSVIAREINNVTGNLYPRLFGVKAAPLLTTDATTYQFGVPAEAEFIMDVNYKFVEIEGWIRATRWELQHGAPADFASGVFVNIFDRIPAGASVQCLYGFAPPAMTSLTDDFATVTGLPDGVKDLVISGVMMKMMQFAEIARLPVHSVGSNTAAPNNPVGTAMNIARAMRQEFEQGVQLEQAANARKYPTRVHRTR